MNIALPHQWRPRDYQMPAWRALERGCKRALLVWHRRSGKDDVALNWTATQALMRPGVYWHMLPEANQARKAIWDAVDPHTGKRRIDRAFPPELRESTRDQFMQVRFRNGSVWQVVGSDNYDSLVGSSPAGVVFSEWALADPASWAFIRPILAENGGWALFITTPRGRNHAAGMFDTYRDDEDWFVQRLPATETGVFSQAQLDAEARGLRAEYGKAVGDALYRQEYLCSFEAPVLGAYYAEWLDDLEDKGAICKVPYDPNGSLVHVSWDLGWSDQTSLWFVQRVGREVHVLDYYAGMGKDLQHYVDAILARFPRAQLGSMILPHDAKAKQRQTGRSDEEFLRNRGFDTVLVGRPQNADALMTEINAVRRFLPRCVFDRERCEEGLSALRNYRSKYDETRRVLQGRPVHDWASHGADSFRTMVMGWDRISGSGPRVAKPVKRRQGVPV